MLQEDLLWGSMLQEGLDAEQTKGAAKETLPYPSLWRLFNFFGKR